MLYLTNAILLDPVTEKTYNVIKRKVTSYRRGKFLYLNINRVPLDYAKTLVKDYPLLLTTETETFMLRMSSAYEPAATWQNIVCKIEESPLKYCEAVAEWQTKLNQNSSTSTT